MTVFLTRVDAVPLENDELSMALESWFSNTVDIINTDLDDIENNFNGINGGIIPGSFTTAQITSMAAAAREGTIWYANDHVLPVLVTKLNGVLVQIVTAAFP